MIQIDKNNYKQFLKRYNDFQYANVKNIDYDFKKSEVCIIFDIRILSLSKETATNEERQIRLKMLFKGVDVFSENNSNMIEFVDYTYMDFYHQNGKSLICFSLNNEDPDVEPYLYIMVLV